MDPNNAKSPQPLPEKTASGRTIYHFRPHAYLNLLGLQRLVPEEGDSQVELVITPDLMNPNGSAHGGSIFSLVDTAMSGALRQHVVAPEFGATVESKINYLKAVRLNDTLLCTASVIQRTARLAVLEAEVHNQHGELVTKAMATFAIMKPRAGASADAPMAKAPQA